MHVKAGSKDISNVIVTIEEQLRLSFGRKQLEMVYYAPPFGGKFQEIFQETGKDNNLELQRYVDELLEKSGPKRPSGKVDTKCFYENICISAATWSNFTNGRFSPETILKIIVGEADMSAFDEFVDNWTSAGGQTITEEINEELSAK